MADHSSLLQLNQPPRKSQAARSVLDILLDGLFYVFFWFGISIAKDVAFAAFRRGRRTESDDEKHHQDIAPNELTSEDAGLALLFHTGHSAARRL